MMKNWFVVLAVVTALYFYQGWKPSTDTIIEGDFSQGMHYAGQNYDSDWDSKLTRIKGYLRQKDRHYDKSIPIITYDLVVTSGDFNNPDRVSLTHNGDGNYSWRWTKVKPKGTIHFYHTIAINSAVQNRLDALKQGDEITLLAYISKNNQISGDQGAFIKINHPSHKFLLVQSAE